MRGDRQWIAAAGVAGIVVLLAALVFVPPPGHLGPVVNLGHGEALDVDGARFAPFSRAIAHRYDAAEDVTYAVFDCDYEACEVSVKIAGDARDQLGEFRFLLVQGTPGPITVEPLEPPISVDHPSGGPQDVNRTTSATFQVRSPLPDMLMVDVGVALAASGLACVPPRMTRRAIIAVAGASAVGAGLGHLLAGDWLSVAIFGILATFIGLLFGGLFVVEQVRGRTNPFFLGVALSALSFIATMWILAPYFPSLPAI